eukprot:TRINITY_DN11739_c0_g1_i1.p1 TRINITY_DN11739_c0_g1~~TRINITY_DN11739_c0_g1_i1.p1  ORF type:complete len:621 (+),score=126.57 TRINITY_DN11739_c0_g1_i1:67-1929(+)
MTRRLCVHALSARRRSLAGPARLAATAPDGLRARSFSAEVQKILTTICSTPAAIRISDVSSTGGPVRVMRTRTGGILESELGRLRGMQMPKRALTAERGVDIVAGIDDSGVAMAGPVFAAALVLPDDLLVEHCRDSKLLEEQRAMQICVDVLRTPGVYCGVGSVEVSEMTPSLDDSWVKKVAMIRAVRSLLQALGRQSSTLKLGLLIDGARMVSAYGPSGAYFCGCPAQEISQGDNLCLSIAAASCVATTLRRVVTKRLSLECPAYGLDRNQGRPTPDHLKAIAIHGPSPKLHSARLSESIRRQSTPDVVRMPEVKQPRRRARKREVAAVAESKGTDKVKKRSAVDEKHAAEAQKNQNTFSELADLLRSLHQVLAAGLEANARVRASGKTARLLPQNVAKDVVGLSESVLKRADNISTKPAAQNKEAEKRKARNLCILHVPAPVPKGTTSAPAAKKEKAEPESRAEKKRAKKLRKEARRLEQNRREEEVRRTMREAETVKKMKRKKKARRKAADVAGSGQPEAPSGRSVPGPSDGESFPNLRPAPVLLACRGSTEQLSAVGLRCSVCCRTLPRLQFSYTQTWSRGPRDRRCKSCCGNPVAPTSSVAPSRATPTVPVFGGA